jgi:hypothetical protein
MVQNQLARYNAEGIGRELLGPVPTALARRFGRWAMNWIQENPERVVDFAQDAYNWLRDNTNEFFINANELAERAAGEIRQGMEQQNNNPYSLWTDYMGTAQERLEMFNRMEQPTQTRDTAPFNEIDLPGELEYPDDIIQSAMESASGTRGGGGGGGKRPPTGPPEGEPEAQRIAASGNSGPNSVSKETPVSPYPTLTYGLQETHTTILPWTGWLSMFGADTAAPLKLKIRMNGPYKMLDITTGNSGQALTKNFYNKPIKENGSLASNDFPDAITNNAAAVNQRPAWRAFWCQLYEYYTVLGCEYKITIVNPINTPGTNIIIGEQMDTFSSTAGETGNVMPLSYLTDALAYKNIKWHTIKWDDAKTGDNIQTITGTYKPGSIKRNIQNDGDVKTWTSTGTMDTPGDSTDDGAPPNLNDFLTLNFWRHPMAYGSTPACNIEVQLKYIVQFKDLRQQARYPARIGGNAGMQINLKQNTIERGTAFQRWG